MKKQQKGSCPLTSDPNKRAEADQQTASIQVNFPPGLSQPALRALAVAGFTHLEQLADIREVDLARLHGVGPKAVRILREALQTRNLSFRS